MARAEVDMVRGLVLLQALLCYAIRVSAQDPAQLAPRNHEVLLENDHVRVLEALLKPGDVTPQHSHPARIVYTLSDHSATFRFPGGRMAHSESKTGETAWREPVTHSEENDGKTDSRAILIELKGPFFRLDALSRTDYFVAGESGARLFVRHVAGPSVRRTPILLVHGGSPGSEVIFDLPVPGYSLAEDFAAMGLDTFLMDARGWGRSTPARDSSEPPGTSKAVVADIAAVVDDILRATGHSKLLLFGHASGGHWTAMYASEHPDKVAGLVLLNSMYSVDAPWELRQAFEDPKRPGVFDASAGPYRLATAEGLLNSWNSAIPVADKSEWRDPQIAAAYVTLALASDPTSASRTPASVRIPGGFRRDHYLLSKGQRFWDAHDVRSPVLYMRGSRDHWSRPEDLEALRRELVAAAGSRFVTIPGGTHFLFLDRPEHGRTQMLHEIRAFLSTIALSGT
jgi:pimeloyl-ACP methyl ester carboxylesterase/quercetin dioxygenase-like cupin family protein